jgi:hypothetical protein
MSVKNYINNARNQAHQNYASFNGYRNFATTTGGTANAGNRMALADGNNAPQSQPYIITISNASGVAVTNFDVLGAYTYINGTSMGSTPAGTVAFSSGSMVVTNTGASGFSITVSSAITNVNYQQFLYQSMTQPFSVGLTYIETVSGSSAQVTTPITLNTQDANGNQMLRTIIPVIDPYQQQSTIVAIKQLYSIDGFTKLTFSTIYASVVFRVHFYPATNVNLASTLQGGTVAQSYTNPMISGVPTIVK